MCLGLEDRLQARSLPNLLKSDWLQDKEEYTYMGVYFTWVFFKAVCPFGIVP